MDEEAVRKVTSTVVRQFPEMDGVRPSVKAEGDGERYVVTYKGSADLPNGKVMVRIVRVVADGSGQVIRISTSR